MKKRIYLAGPVSGLPEAEAERRFATAQALMQAEGHSCCDPFEKLASSITWFVANVDRVNIHETRKLERENWSDCMRLAVKLMMDCDEVVMLPDWQKSRGAVIERNLAISLDIPVRYLNKL